MNTSPRGTDLSRVLLAALVGASVIVLVAIAARVPAADAVKLAAIGSGVALAGAIGGACVLHFVRRQSLAVQIAATALVVLIAVGAGAFVAAQAMFLSEHDLAALSVILVAAGVVGVGTAVALGRRVGRASQTLIDVARGIGTGEVALVESPPAVPQELARLYHELLVASARLDDARRREQALEASRRELVAWVSHDLRTPLAAIRAVAEALEDGVVSDPETVARYHTTLRVEADRLSGLVDDLFELSRTQAGVLRLELGPVSLGDLVSDAIAGARATAEAKGVRIEGRLAATATDLDASAAEVLRALRNILENAIRHTPSDGTVLVEADADDDYAYISVQDSGGGIPDDDLPRVFDVAFSGNTARTPGSGAGLGLAIARGLVEAHRGDLTVRNECDGARFTVRLPLSVPREWA
ncbi:MAG: HAMP domain-containing sensor histidine kinase [Acidimicrobiia bacterium]